MHKHAPAVQVGAPDPELRNSPILDRLEDAGELSLDNELEAGVCYFNDRRFAIGDCVRSGDELLRCQERGVWVKLMEEHLS
jgi:hypothetical protein